MKSYPYSTTGYHFKKYKSSLYAKQDQYNCGVVLIGAINLQTEAETKSILKQLKTTMTTNKVGSSMLRGRSILLGTINKQQKDSMESILKPLGFKIGQSFTNPNSGNKCYVITGNINKLKI